MKKTVGFIGLGRMGTPMAMRLLNAGHSLCVFDIIPDAMKPFEEKGADTASSIKELASKADVIITIVPADKHIYDIYTGSDGIIDNAKEGLLCIEMTSAMGITLKKIKQYAEEKAKNISFVDAPVSGGVDGASNGTLTIMVGGEDKDIESAKPYLEILGSKLLYSGKLGDGKSVKMINQMLNALNTAAAAEAMYLAKELGIDTSILLDIVNNSSGGSWVMKNNVPKFMLTGNYDSGFKLGLMTKDLRLSASEADSNNLDLPLVKQALKEYEEAIAMMGENVNYNSVFEWVKNHNKREENKNEGN